MLPKIDVPTFDVEIPSTREVLKFRPFLVKEEKILMLANTSGEIAGMIGAATQVVSNCALSELDVSKLTLFDLQYVFVRIKAQSVGEMSEFKLTCGKEDCPTAIDYTLNLNDIKVSGLDDLPKSFIKVTEDVGIQLTWPVAEMYATEEELKDSEVVALCVDHVVDDEEIINIREEPFEAVQEFIESLPLSVYKEIKEFFLKIPYVDHIIEYKCPACETENTVQILGHEHFFV